jgi:photosystem II stability/assembly factor-like uncharacterized protein
MKRFLLTFALLIVSKLVFTQISFNDQNGQISTNYNNKVFWADQNTVYAAGSYLDFNAPFNGGTGYIHKSNDNGSTFKPIRVRDSSSYYGVWFSNKDIGFACGTESLRAVVLKTTDGGATWKSKILEGDIVVKELYFINDKIGFVGGGSGGSIIYKTIDAGESWVNVFDDGLTVQKIQFVTEQKGYAVTSEGILLVTTNQGMTWQKVTIDTRYNSFENPLWARSMYWMSEDVGIVGTEKGIFYKTNNGGLSWKIIGVPDNRTISDIKFLTPSLGYAVGIGSGNFILRTKNGGETWDSYYSTSVYSLQTFNNIAWGKEGLNTSMIITGFRTFLKAGNLNPDLDGTRPTAVLQGTGSTCGDSTATVRLDILGDNPPFAVKYGTLIGGVVDYTTINDVSVTPYYLKIKPKQENLNTYFLSELTNSLGVTGTISGSASIYKNAPSKAILKNVIDTICPNGSTVVPIELSGCSPWKLEYTDGENVITESNITNAQYGLKISSKKTATFTLKSITDATGKISTDVSGKAIIYIDTAKAMMLTDTIVKCQGYLEDVKINLSGRMPYTIHYSIGNDSFKVENINSAFYKVNVKVDINPVVLQKVTNGCGQGITSGSVQFRMNEYFKFPTNLTFTLPDSNRQKVIVNWTNNSSHQEGYRLEKKPYYAPPDEIDDYKYTIPPIGWQNVKSSYGNNIGNQTIIDDIETSGKWYYRFRTYTSGCKIPIYSKLDSLALNDYFEHKKGNYTGYSGDVNTDINNDDLQDLITNGFVLTGNGTEFKSDQSIINLGSFRFGGKVTGVSAIADYDNDGYNDMLFTDKLQKQFRKNDLREIRDYISWDNVESIGFFSDLDNDGKLDIVRSSPFRVIQNKGDDVNVTLSNSFFGDDAQLFAMPIDVNNDFKTDIIFIKTDTIIIYFNEGGMSFKKRVASYIKIYPSYSTYNRLKVEMNDFNNDGWEDFYNGNSYFINQKNNSFLEDKHFINVYKIGDIDNNGYTDAVDNLNQIRLYQSDTIFKPLNNVCTNLSKLIDSNNDGFLDIFGTYYSRSFYSYSNMFINNKKLSNNNGISIKCVGVTSNRSAIGAVVKIKTKINSKIFTQFKKITEGVVHFGVGELNTIDTIEVRFPSGKIVLQTNVVPNRLLTIYEEPLPPLFTPNSLVATCRDFKTADLAWKHILGDYAGLIIERSLSADKDFTPIDTLFEKSTTFKDSSLMRGVQYFYRIRIFSDGRKSNYSNIANVFIFTTCDLGAKLLNPATIEANMGDWVELNAQSNEKVSYRWYNYDTQAIVGSDSDTSSTFRVPIVGKNYYYRLKYSAIAIKNNQCVDTTNPVEIIFKSELFKFEAKKDRDIGFWEHNSISNSSWADFDNDGDDDVIISGSSGSFGRRIYRNEGNNTFAKMNIPISPNIDSVYSTEFLSWGDYNNDGNIDIVFAERYQDIVLKNNGNGGFEKQSINPMPYKDGNLSSIWHDLNKDGFLDIITCHVDSTYIYINDKGNNFVLTMSLTRTDQQSVGIIDYDNDGLDDILLIGFNRPTKVERLYYYKNKGNGIFVEVESKTLNSYFNEISYWNSSYYRGVTNNINILDINNDGLMDIYLSRENLVQSFLINKGNGIFEPTVIEGLESLTRDKTYLETLWADFDNNGWLDCLVSNDMYMALGNGKFVKDTLLSDRNLQYNDNYNFRSMFADTDNDGFLEVLQNCYFKSESFDTYRWGYYLFENAKNSNHWLTIKAKGTKSNRLGIGTTINAIINLNGKKLTLTRRIMGQTSTTGQSPQKAYFGLGNATIIDSLIVKFPSGIIRKFTNIPVDQILEISEDETEIPKFALSVEGKDTCMNKVTITLKVTNGQSPYKYVWSNGETTPSVSNLSRGIYTVTVTDAANGKVIKEFNVKTCVWPGDTDSSGIVNHFDLLNIGLNYNMVGLTRSGQDQNINWYGHKADGWSKNTVNTTVNVNHSDADGDGFVSYKDTSAINLHWEKKHNLKSPNSTSSSTLNAAPPISIETSPVSENKRYSFPIILGDNDNLVSAIYGLGFSIDYDINKINPNSINVIFDKCWLGKDILTISKNFEDIGRMEVALVRKNGFNINGKGQIGTLNFTVKNGVSNSSLSFGIKNSKAIDNGNKVLILSEKVTSSTITAIGDVNWDSKILVYPNPVETMLNIESNDLEIKQIELFDFRGIKLLNMVSKSLIQTIDMKDFSNSFYILKISTDKGIVIKKVIKTN